MAEASDLALLLGIFAVAFGGCVSGILASVLSFVLSAESYQTRLMASVAVFIGLLTLLLCAAIGELRSFWLLLPAGSCACGFFAVFRIRRGRARRARRLSVQYRSRTKRRRSNRLRLAI